MANRASQIVHLVCTAVFAMPSFAEEPRLLELRIEGEMSAELKFALARVLAPDSNDADLILSLQNALPVEAVATTGLLPVGSTHACQNRDSTDYECAVMASLTAGRLVPTPGQYKGMRTVSSGNYYFLTKDSGVLQTYGGTIAADRAANGAGVFVKVPGQSDLASELPESWLTRIFRRTPTANVVSVSEPLPLDFDPKVASVLRQLHADLREHRFSSRIFEISPSASAEAIETLQRLARGQGAAASITEVASSVEIDYPSDSVVQTSAQGGCVDSPADWPFDKDAVRSVLQRNDAVLQRMGITPTVRSNIVVIDSGVSALLARHARFRPFLVRNSMLELNPSRFTYTPEGTESCWLHGSRPAMASHGYVANAGNICVGDSPWDALAPPEAIPSQSTYLPDHGGVVATVAMGGPEMLDTQELRRWIGVSFVRVMRESESKLRVMSDASDVAEAFQYAREQNATIATASLKIQDRDFNFLATPIRDYWATGLVVASAGNSGLELANRSGSFPASVSTGSDEAGIIIVGGVTPPQTPADPAPQFWQSSAWSTKLVDIAAPATHIKSLDRAANLACYAGTSVAAPQVSFAAAIISALGITKPLLVKRRILATADEFVHLDKKFRNGRVLNLPLALDVFTDLLWIDGAKEPLRGELLPPESLPNGGTVIRACTRSGPLSGSGGWIDPAQLLYWRRRSESEAEVWIEEAGTASRMDAKCVIPTDEVLRFRTRTDQGLREIIKVKMVRVDRIVPTRLRPAVRASMAF